MRLAGVLSEYTLLMENELQRSDFSPVDFSPREPLIINVTKQVKQRPTR